MQVLPRRKRVRSLSSFSAAHKPSPPVAAAKLCSNVARGVLARGSSSANGRWRQAADAARGRSRFSGVAASGEVAASGDGEAGAKVAAPDVGELAGELAGTTHSSAAGATRSGRAVGALGGLLNVKVFHGPGRCPAS